MAHQELDHSTPEGVSEELESLAARYERARKFGRTKADTVFRDQIQTWWREDNSQFCYEVKTGPDTFDYVRVDVGTGHTRPVFERSKLISALTKAGIKDADRKQLRLRIHKWDTSNKLKCSTMGSLFEIDLETSDLTNLHEEVDDKKLLDKIPAKGGHGGQQASITFTNETLDEVEIFWLSSEGQRKSYGKLAAKAWRLYSSYERHVWVIVNTKGEDVCAFQVLLHDSYAVIESQEGVDKKEKDKDEEEEKEKEKEQTKTSPDSKWIALIRDHNVFLKEKVSDQEYQLTKDGVKGNAYEEPIAWSPDSKNVAITRIKEGEERLVSFIESSPEDRVQPRLHSNQYQKPGDRVDEYSLFLIDLETRNCVQIDDTLFPNPWAVHPGFYTVKWVPDSSKFYFEYYQRGHKLVRLITVGRSTKEPRVVVEEKSDTFLNCEGEYFHDWSEDTGEVIWSSERDGWNHLYLFDSKTGDVKNQITKGSWRVEKVDGGIDWKKRQIWFYACGIKEGQNPYYKHMCRIDLDGKNLVVLTDGDGDHEVKWSPDNRYLIDTWSRVDKAPTIELRRASDGKLVRVLEEADTTLLRKSGWRPPIPFSTRGRDGKTLIHGVIQYPLKYISDKRYPVLEYIYAGPHSHSIPTAFKAFHRVQTYSELGFIHVTIDGMGTNGRSKAFHDVCHLNLADGGLPDHILFLAAAAARYPEIDLTRVGIYGTSAGGQSSLRALLDHSDIYKVGVAINGCHDNRMDKTWWNEQFLGWPVDEEVYKANSNVVHAHRLSDEAKLMLVVGEMDTNVDPASTMQVVNALIKADKDFELVVVPGGGHGCGEDAWVKKKIAMFLMRELKVGI